MPWLPGGAPGQTPFERILGLRPDAHARFRDLESGLRDAPGLDPVILDLCRLRIGTLIGAAADGGAPGTAAG